MARLEKPVTENRLMDALLYYQSENIAHQARQPVSHGQDHKGRILDLHYYRQLVAAQPKKLNQQEKTTRSYINYQIQLINFKTSSGFSNSILALLKLARASLKLQSIKQNELILVRAHQATAIQHSVARINDQLQKAGFHQNIQPHVQKMMEQGLSEFHYRYFDIHHPNTDFVLYFNKQPGSSIYQFQKFEAAQLPHWQQLREHKSHYVSFDTMPGTQISATEASSLVAGRAIALENAANQWIVLDSVNKQAPFRVVHFDLDACLQSLPLPAMNQLEYQQLKEALQKGETKELTIDYQGTPTLLTLQASPAQQTVYITDKYNQLINHRELTRKPVPNISENILQHKQQQQQQQEYVPRYARG